MTCRTSACAGGWKIPKGQPPAATALAFWSETRGATAHESVMADVVGPLGGRRVATGSRATPADSAHLLRETASGWYGPSVRTLLALLPGILHDGS